MLRVGDVASVTAGYEPRRQFGSVNGINGLFLQIQKTSDASEVDVAVLLATAGTGGPHKRAMLSHRALVANLVQCAQLNPPPVTATDTVLLALPLFHIFGLNAVFGPALLVGATVVVATDLDPAATLSVVAESGVTSVAGTPTMFNAWAALPQAREALAGVRVLVSGSTPLRPADAEAFRAATGHTVWQGYGLTEAAPVVSASTRARPGSVGAPLPGVEIRVLDAEGKPAAEGDPGELWIRGQNLFSGYWPDGARRPGPRRLVRHRRRRLGRR